MNVRKKILSKVKKTTEKTIVNITKARLSTETAIDSIIVHQEILDEALTKTTSISSQVKTLMNNSIKILYGLKKLEILLATEQETKSSNERDSTECKIKEVSEHIQKTKVLTNVLSEDLTFKKEAVKDLFSELKTESNEALHGLVRTSKFIKLMEANITATENDLSALLR